MSVYMDNIMAQSSFHEEHLPHVLMVFKTLCTAQRLYAKRLKCSFASSEVVFLGHILSVDCVKADTAKVEAVCH